MLPVRLALSVAIVMASCGVQALDSKPWLNGSGPADGATRQTSAPATAQAAPSASTTQPDAAPPVQMVYPQPYIYIPPPVAPRKERTQWVEDEVMGMTPEEIRAFKADYRKRQAAASDAPPEMRTSTVPITLEPGAGFPTVMVSPGHVSSLVFLDAGGDPWPVKGVSWGDRETFKVEPPPENDKSAPQNVIAVSLGREIGATSMSVLLEGKAVPVIIQLKVDRKVTDARVDLRLNEYGPKSNPSNQVARSNIPAQAGDTVMTSFLDGVPVDGSRELAVEGAPMRAWMMNDVMYVRTIVSLLSPAFDAVEYGAGGVRVYRMSQSSVLLYAHNGGTNMARIIDGGRM